MSWEAAMRRALRRARSDRTKFYVRGWQRNDGGWVYGAFYAPRPNLPGRTWSA